MKDSINHALLITTLLERDIARICASGNETQQGLAADCAEHRIAIANKLRHIKHMDDIAYVISAEQSFKAGDFNGDAPKLGAGWDEINRYCDAKAGDINPVSDKQYHADLIRKENVEMWRNCDRKANWLGCGLACIAAGAILAGIKIWFTYF